MDEERRGKRGVTYRRELESWCWVASRDRKHDECERLVGGQQFIIIKRRDSCPTI